jgi:hypothetical protein
MDRYETGTEAREHEEAGHPGGSAGEGEEGSSGPSPDLVASTVEALRSRVEDRDALRGTIDPHAPLGNGPGEPE